MDASRKRNSLRKIFVVKKYRNEKDDEIAHTRIVEERALNDSIESQRLVARSHSLTKLPFSREHAVFLGQHRVALLFNTEILIKKCAKAYNRNKS